MVDEAEAEALPAEAVEAVRAALETIRGLLVTMPVPIRAMVFGVLLQELLSDEAGGEEVAP